MQAKLQGPENVRIKALERVSSHSLNNSIYKLEKTSNYLRKQKASVPITPKHHSYFENSREYLNLDVTLKDQLALAGKEVVGVVKKRVQNLKPVLGDKGKNATVKKESKKSSEDVMRLPTTNSMLSTNGSWSDTTKSSSTIRKNPLDYFTGENQFVFFHNIYSDQLKDLKRRKWVKHPLQNHKISETMRTRMTDWMLEVIKTFECCNQTYFLSVSVFDRFLEAYAEKGKVLEDNDVHLIGVSSMFIANKFQQPRPLSLSVFYSKIAHKSFTKEELLKVEEEILTAIQFDLNYASPHQVLSLYLGSIAHVAQTLGFRDEIYRKLLNRIKEFACLLLQYSLYFNKNLALGPFILAYIALTSSIRYCKHKPGLYDQKLKLWKKDLTVFLKRMYKEASVACLLPLSKHIDKSEQELYEELIKSYSSSKGKSTFMRSQLIRLTKSLI